MKVGILSAVMLLFTGVLYAQSPCDSLPIITINASDTATCLGGEITLTASGGLNYQWNNGIVNGVSFTPSASQNYTVIVTDTIGCIDTASITIDVLALPSIEANASSLSICDGDSVFLEATGAQSYNWITPSISNGSYFSPSAIGVNTFVVEGTGSNGCINTSQVIVVMHEIPELPVLNQPGISTCLEVAFDGTIEGTTNDGRVIWFSDEALTEIVSDQPILPLQNTEVGVTTFWASSFDNGCYSPGVAAEVEVFANPTVNAGEDQEVEAGRRGELEAISNSEVSASWVPETQLENPFSLQTGYTGVESIDYTITVEDENGCIASDEISLIVKSNLVISNIMTPDGNGENDTWKMYPEVVLETCEVQLYDGFGRELLNTNDYRNDWDGTYEGEAVPDGDYYYYVKCSGGFSEKGTLTILK